MASKIKYSERFYEISFSDKISKQAYLNACKWLAQKVYSKEELTKYVAVQIEKEKESKLPTFNVKLYITISESELKIEYCKKCKSLHSLISVGSPDCNTCRMSGYRQYENSSIKNLVDFWKGAFESEEEI